MEPNNAGENGEKTSAPEAQPSEEKKGSVPYARFKEVVEQRQAAEEALKNVVDELTNGLPEDLRPLVPDLPPAGKIAWMRQAREAGLFKRPAPPAAPELDAKRPGGKPPADLKNLNATQLLSAGYK